MTPGARQTPALESPAFAGAIAPERLNKVKINSQELIVVEKFKIIPRRKRSY
ncbi:MAG: hypothetical protein HY746_01255 [Elusimicrobia bacterium]|nr:hypothetical protein [Elusimicrobiota bacterium]